MFNYFVSFLLEETPGEGGGEYPEWKLWGRVHLDMDLWRGEEEEEHVRLLWHLVVEDDGWARVAMPIMGNTKKYDKLIGGEGKLHYERIPPPVGKRTGRVRPRVVEAIFLRSVFHQLVEEVADLLLLFC